MNALFDAFNKRFNFIVCASIFYELLVIGHATAILYLLGFEAYGLIGSLLSIIHVGTHLADWGMTNSIAPHLHLFLQSKQCWRQLFFRYTLAPHAPIIVATALGTIAFFSNTSLYISFHMYLLLLTLIILDTIKSFMRQFLYALFKTTMVATTEINLLIGRLALLWGLHFCTSIQLSLKLIIWSHVASTLVCLALFSRQLFGVYKTLPDASDTPFKPLWFRLFWTRINNYFLRVSRNVFTTHFLTPLFALQFGLKTAGIFFFASKLAKIVQAAVKLSIGYSGNGVLARVKNEPIAIKRAAFEMLSTKLLDIVIPSLTLFLPAAAGALHYGYLQGTAQQMFMLSLLFLLITFFEFFFMLYEQWYILEESAHTLFFIKIFELIALAFLTLNITFSPIELLCLLITIRAIHFGFIVIHSYITWGITFSYRLSVRTCTWYMAITCLSLYFLNKNIL